MEQCAPSLFLTRMSRERSPASVGRQTFLTKKPAPRVDCPHCACSGHGRPRRRRQRQPDRALARAARPCAPTPPLSHKTGETETKEERGDGRADGRTEARRALRRGEERGREIAGVRRIGRRGGGGDGGGGGRQEGVGVDGGEQRRTGFGTGRDKGAGRVTRRTPHTAKSHALVIIMPIGKLRHVASRQRRMEEGHHHSIGNANT